jgi:hypothetical protein
VHPSDAKALSTSSAWSPPLPTISAANSSVLAKIHVIALQFQVNLLESIDCNVSVLDSLPICRGRKWRLSTRVNG